MDKMNKIHDLCCFFLWLYVVTPPVRRAASAISTTQATTAASFLATAFSRIMPIAAFGIWAAIIITLDFVLVITLYPSLLIIHFRYVEPFEKKYCLWCCYCCSQDDNQREENKSDIGMSIDIIGAQLDGTSNNNTGTIAGNNNDNNNSDSNDNKNSNVNFNNTAKSIEIVDNIPIAPNLEHRKTVEEQSVHHGWLERFFALIWYKWINKLKVYILILFVILFGVAIYAASLLEEQDESQRLFVDSHFMQKMFDLSQKFSAGEDGSAVYVITYFGIKGVDRDNSDWFDPTDYGVFCMCLMFLLCCVLKCLNVLQ